MSVLPTFKIFRPAAPARAARDGDGVKGVKVPSAAPPEEVASVAADRRSRAFSPGVDQIEEHELLAQSAAAPSRRDGRSSATACERPRK